MTTPPIAEVYNGAQTFYLDPESVKGATTVGISSIDLFFKQKPNATANKSGIVDPGVTLFICETSPDKIPLIAPFSSGTIDHTAYVEHAMIATSADASRPTNFKFAKPILVSTGKEYAIVIKYDANENFVLWNSKQGDLLTGTNKISPGPSGKYVGNYYTAYYVPPSTPATSDPSIPVTPPTQTSAWKSISDTDLKFRVYVARYSVNGVPVSNTVGVFGANVAVYGTSTNTANIVYTTNAVNFQVSTNHYEYFKYDKKISKPQVKGGEWVYQNTVFWPGGAANGVSISVQKGSKLITANTYLPNGQLFNWNSLYGSSNNAEYIVIVSLNDDSAGERRTDIRKVVAIDSNTVLRVEEGMNFTNASAYFIKSPVAQVTRAHYHHHHDRHHHDFKRGEQKRRKVRCDFLEVNHSNANASNRFVNDCINSVSVSVGGLGYSNTDYITINGYENIACAVVGGYPAKANLVTNSSGGITAVYLSNVGCGFVNTAWIAGSNIVYSNSTGGTSAGSSANLAFTTGMVIRAEFDGDDRKGGYFMDCEVSNHEISHMIPHVDVHNPAGVTHGHYYSHGHHCIVANTWLGVQYFCYHSDWSKYRKQVQPFVHNHFHDHPHIPVHMSRSNEFVVVDPTTCAVSSNGGGSGNVEVVGVSNSDFVCLQPGNVAITFSRFKINDDYTGENTNYGNAEAKHITKKINFANGRFAEDIVAYITAYRPLNTDVKVFARIHNSNDPEAFDDKDWTMLELKEGNVFSSSADTNNYVEMTFGFQKHPNVAISLGGTVAVADNTTTNVIGSGTTFSTNTYANLQVNDLIKISSPLFPDSYEVCVVTDVANDTQISISKPISNVDLGALNSAGLYIDLIGRVGNDTVNSIGYPLQAFNSRFNDNTVRYYSSSMSEYDKYDSLQMKIVLLSDIAQVNSISANVIPTTIPRVDDIRVIGVTA